MCQLTDTQVTFNRCSHSHIWCNFHKYCRTKLWASRTPWIPPIAVLYNLFESQANQLHNAMKNNSIKFYIIEKNTIASHVIHTWDNSDSSSGGNSSLTNSCNNKIVATVVVRKNMYCAPARI